MKFVWGILIAILLLNSGCTSLANQLANTTLAAGSNTSGTGNINVVTDNSQGSSVPDLIATLKQSVVYVNYTGKSDDYYYGGDFELIGSGVIYSVDNDYVYVVTNRHVVDLNYPDMVGNVKDEQITIRTYDNNTYYATDRLVAPKGIDLAILKFKRDNGDFYPANFSDTLPKTGDDVFVIGMPELLEWSVSKGIVSGIRDFDTPTGSGDKYTAIQTDAAVNEGNSGGGMFTSDGRLVGFNAWKYVGYDVQGLNFAISALDFLKFKDQFMSKPLVGSQYLAPTLSNNTPAGIGYLGAFENYGDYYSYTPDSYNLTFTLEDSVGDTTVSDGRLEVVVADEEAHIIYDRNSTVRSSDYSPIADYPFYGRYAYTSLIKTSDFKQTNDSYATATVHFYTNGTNFTKSTELYLPYSYDYGYGGSSYYGENLSNISIYVSNSGMGLNITQGGLDGYGDYNLYTTVNNVGSDPVDVEVKDAVLVTGGNQYDASYYSPVSLGTIYPQAGVENDLTFYSVSNVGSDATLYLSLRVIDGDQVKNVDYTVKFTP